MANTQLTEILIRHQIYLQRYAGGLWNDVKPVLLQIEKDVIKELIREDLSDITRYRLSQLERQIRNIIDTSDLEQLLTSRIDELVEYEQLYLSRVIQGFVSVKYDLIDVTRLVNTVRQSPMRLISGKKTNVLFADDMYSVLSRSMVREISTTVSSGVVAGDSTGKIVTNVRRLAFGKTRRDTEAVVRTITNHVASQTKRESFNHNAELFSGLKYIATLDTRTSILCASRDGRIYPLDTTVTTPAHFNCRSTMIPVIKDEYNLDQGGGRRASVDGPVSAKLTYDGFLRKQSKEFQNDVLGTGRAKLFRNGMPIKSFTNDNGIVYNLADLQNADSENL